MRHLTAEDRKAVKYFAGHVLVIALSLAFLAHFALIIKQGTVLIQEPRSWVLWSEVTLLVGCLVYAVTALITYRK